VRVAALLALISSLTWGVADFLGGLAARRAGAAQVLAVSYPAGAVVITFVAIFVVPGQLSTDLIGISVLTGVVGAIAIALLYAAFVRGQMGVVSPITAVMSGAVPVIVGIFRGEQPSSFAFVGMGLAVFAVILVSRESAHHHGRTPISAIGLAVVAGFAIGIYLTVIGLAPIDSGVWVASMGRWVSTLIMITFVIVVSRSFDRTTFPWKLAIITGMLDSMANGFFQLASQRGLLSIVAVLGSLYPVATVVLARVVIKERMNRVQSIGVLLALSAAGLLAFNS
jgi:drug/metabolite transporter (DMT)-like permease